MRVLIVGCGYVGLSLGIELVRLGHEVFGLRRDLSSAAELAAAGIQPIGCDITRPEEIAKLPGPWDWVVNTASSDKGGADEYRRVYLEGTRHLVQWLAPAPPRKYIHTSSTSVYGQTDGAQVKETSPTEPQTETGRGHSKRPDLGVLAMTALR